MKLRPPTAVALATATLVVSGGIAYAAVQSVDTHPPAEVVVPASVEVSPPAHRHGGADDAASHDANDDRGGDRHGHGHGDDHPGSDD